MSEEFQNEANNIIEAKKKTGPRAAFPRLKLSKVLPLAKQVYELGEGDPVPRLVVFDRLGKSPESGPSRMLVTTSSAYGLTAGGYQAERLGITERGRSIVGADSDEAARGYAVKALLDNGLFAQFYKKYQSKGVPQEPIAVDYLKQVGNLAEADAKTAYEVFIANMTDYGFVKEMSGRQTIVSQDLMDLQVPDKADTRQVNPRGEAPKANTHPDEYSSSDSTLRQSVGKNTILPQFNFNIQVQLPENATTETYEAIFKSMAEHLLKT